MSTYSSTTCDTTTGFWRRFRTRLCHLRRQHRQRRHRHLRRQRCSNSLAMLGTFTLTPCSATLLCRCLPPRTWSKMTRPGIWATLVPPNTSPYRHLLLYCWNRHRFKLWGLKLGSAWEKIHYPFEGPRPIRNILQPLSFLWAQYTRLP